MSVGNGFIGGNMQTNFDKITENPQTLAEFINRATLGCHCCGTDGIDEQKYRCVFGKCSNTEEIMEWLEQESEDG